MPPDPLKIPRIRQIRGQAFKAEWPDYFQLISTRPATQMMIPAILFQVMASR